MSILYQNFFRLCSANFQQMGCRKSWSFSFESRYTVTRTTLFRFADTTSASVPQAKDFPVRGNQLHPRVKQRSTSPQLPPQERQNYITYLLPASIAAPAQTGMMSDTPRQMQIPHRICKHGAESMHTCSKRHLFPGQRSADDIAVRADGNLVRQLALRW